MAHVRFIIPNLPTNTPDGVLFLTGDHRKWGDDPEGWTFVRSGQAAVLEADLPGGALLGVKVCMLHDGKSIEEGDAWGGRTPAHKAVVHGDMEIQLQLEGWQDVRQGRGWPSASAPPREEMMLAAPWGEQKVRLWWPDTDSVYFAHESGQRRFLHSMPGTRFSPSRSARISRCFQHLSIGVRMNRPRGLCRC
ncbi:hypothetical protein DESA109040_05070 [Deinococcus saxicola]|uniref:hypothetical protein n=1 Tax=Deinococcus saxicola TaxID=249406 RepID=UPI0039EFAFC7